MLIPGPLTWVRGLRGWHRQYRPGHQAQRARTTTQLGAAASGPSSSGRRMRPLVPTPPSPPCSTSTPTFLTFARTFQVSLSRITVFYLWILFCCDLCLTGIWGVGGGGVLSPGYSCFLNLFFLENGCFLFLFQDQTGPVLYCCCFYAYISMLNPKLSPYLFYLPLSLTLTLSPPPPPCSLSLSPSPLSLFLFFLSAFRDQTCYL